MSVIATEQYMHKLIVYQVAKTRQVPHFPFFCFVLFLFLLIGKKVSSAYGVV